MEALFLCVFIDSEINTYIHIFPGFWKKFFSKAHDKNANTSI